MLALKSLLTLSLVSLLVGCNAAPTRQEPSTIYVPIPVKCVSTVPVRPIEKTLDSEADSVTRLGNRLIFAEELELYADKLEVIVEGCK